MRTILAFLICLTPVGALAGCDLDDMVGWTLIARKTIASTIDSDGHRRDDFEGCDFDRVVVFDDNTGVRCTTYSYTYSYRPKAYIWANGVSMKMCVGSREFSVS